MSTPRNSSTTAAGEVDITGPIKHAAAEVCPRPPLKLVCGVHFLLSAHPGFFFKADELRSKERLLGNLRWRRGRPLAAPLAYCTQLRETSNTNVARRLRRLWNISHAVLMSSCSRILRLASPAGVARRLSCGAECHRNAGENRVYCLEAVHRESTLRLPQVTPVQRPAYISLFSCNKLAKVRALELWQCTWPKIRHREPYRPI